MSDPGIGKLIDGPAGRDAIHVAVAPVAAGESLWPGAGVSLDAAGLAVVDNVEPIGIVDPFLSERVLPGERFWLFLYPNTVTSLRHVWSHPAFPVKAPGGGAANG